jgi:spatacsin
MHAMCGLIITSMYPIYQLHELEIRIWLLAVEAEVEMQNGHNQDSVSLNSSGQTPITPDSPVDCTAHIVEVVDKHLRSKYQREVPDVAEAASSSGQSSPQKLRRKLKHLKHTSADIVATEVHSDVDQRDAMVRASAEGMYLGSLGRLQKPRYTKSTHGGVFSSDMDTEKDNLREGFDTKEKTQQSDRTPRRLHSGTWEERIGEEEVERAVLALVEVGQVMAAKQLQQKLSPAYVPLELLLVEDAQKVAMLSVPAVDNSVLMGIFHTRVVEALGTKNLISKVSSGILMQVHLT